MNKTGLIAKISIKYVLLTCIWIYFWRILRYFAFFGEFCGISRKYLNFAGPRPREISEALYKELKLTTKPFTGHTLHGPLIQMQTVCLRSSGVHFDFYFLLSLLPSFSLFWPHFFFSCWAFSRLHFGGKSFFVNFISKSFLTR